MAITDGDVFTQIISFVVGSGDEFQNKFTWEWQGNDHPESGVIGSMDGWAEDFYELMAAYLQDDVTSFTSEYNLIEWDAINELWEIVSNIGFGSGTVTFTDITDILPFQCCPCLVGFTSRPKSRGRKFIPLFCEDSQLASNWVPAAETDLADALAEYIALFTIETGKDAIPGIASTVTGTFLPFLSGMVRDIVFTQRRRTRGRGI